MASNHVDLNVVHLSTVHEAGDVRIRHKECRSVAEAGHDVVLLARTPLGETDLHDGVAVEILVPSLSPRLGRLLLQFGLFRRFWGSRPDVVHFHDPELLLLSLALRFIRIPTIYDVHENLAEQVPNKQWIPARMRPLVSKLIDLAEPVLARSCHTVVVVDADWTARFQEHKVVTLRNLPFINDYEAGTLDRLREASPTFVYVGTLLPERGTEWLLRVSHALPDETKIVLGGAAKQAGYQHYLDSLPAGPNLERPGWLNRQQMEVLLSDALAGVVTLAPTRNYDRAIATKLFEYARAGLPMILTDTSMHRELNEQFDFAILVPFDDDDALLAAMASLASDRDRAIRLATNAKAFARDHSWEQEVEPLLRRYHQIGVPGSV